MCTRRGIVLIFDEVFVGFRLAPGGAQEYFGVRADMVTYGKTLGGGLPVGVVCGRRDLMKRFRDDRPADICFARGTFNAHPYVMGAMHEFLERLETPAVRDLYVGLDELWNRRARDAQRASRRRGSAGAGGQSLQHLDGLLHAALPLQLDAAVLPARRRAGLVLGRHRALHLQPELQRGGLRRGRRALRGGGAAMQRDGWWWEAPGVTDKAIRRGILREMLAHRLGLTGSNELAVNVAVDRQSARNQSAMIRRPCAAWRDASGRSVRRAAGRAAPCSRASRSWNGSVRIFVIQTRPVCTSRMKNSCTVRNSRPPTPTTSQMMPTWSIERRAIRVPARTGRTASDQRTGSSGASAQMAISTILRRRL